MALLDAARFSQGVAGALIWSGALTWLITMTPPERRGSVIGTALGTAVAGALIGPALGALAAEIGTEAVFSAVLAISAVFGVLAWRTARVGAAGAAVDRARSRRRSPPGRCSSPPPSSRFRR